MSNESNATPEERQPDAFAEWRRLLRQPDAIPGLELAGKDVTWDKLLDRLGEKPRRHFLAYRLIAACLLILLIPAARLFQRQPASKDRPNSARIRPAIVEPVPVHPAVTAPDATGSAQAHPPTPATLPGSANANPPVLAKTNPSQPKAILRTRPQPGLAQPAQPNSAPPAIAAPAQLATTVPSPVLPPPQNPKKQWKVVDINELDPGRPRPHTMADNRQPTLLRLGLGIRNTTVNDNLRDDDTRLKIDLNTQNH